MNKNTIEIPISLINEISNNYELGERIRKIASELISDKHSIFPDNLEYNDEYNKPNYIDPYHPLKNN
jgi:hypothetical protein